MTIYFVAAHTTQFTKPGWLYTRHGDGVTFLEQGGSMVTLQSPDKENFTIIIETMVRYNWAPAWQNQQNDLRAQQRLRSAWASTKSDHFKLPAWTNLVSLTTLGAHSKDCDQTSRIPRLIWVFAGHTCYFVGLNLLITCLQPRLGSEYMDQSLCLCSLIRIFAVCMKKRWDLG